MKLSHIHARAAPASVWPDRPWGIVAFLHSRCGSLPSTNVRRAEGNAGFCELKAR